MNINKTIEEKVATIVEKMVPPDPMPEALSQKYNGNCFVCGQPFDKSDGAKWLEDSLRTALQDVAREIVAAEWVDFGSSELPLNTPIVLQRTENGRYGFTLANSLEGKDV